MKKTIPLLIALCILCLGFPARAEDEEIVHTVKKGDTLWDISNMYLKTPWSWPLIWANNENITNPHLIYPGDKVIISTKDGLIQIKVVPTDREGQPQVFTLDQLAGQKGKTLVLAPNFASYIYSATPLETKGTVVATEDDRTMASLGDMLMIKMSAPTTARGLAVIAKLMDVKAPSKDNKEAQVIGYLYRVVGLAKVTDTQSGIIRARLAFNNQEVKTGTLVTDEFSKIQPLTFTLNQPKLSGEGTVVDFWGGVMGSSSSEILITDVGSSQGVQKGSLLSIYKKIPIKNNPSVEDYQGLAMVIQALPGSSMALVVESKAPLEKGFKVSGQ